MLHTEDVRKTYRRGDGDVHAIDGLSVGFEAGDLVIVHGPSGSGKSTLLLMLGGMLPPDAGSVRFDNEDIYRWSAPRRNRYRQQTVGFVFQRFHLFPYLTVRDNIRIPLTFRREKADRSAEIEALSERLGIAHRLHHRPAELSVGEQQRVAMARALVGNRSIILADEPTGNLDTGNARIIASCLAEEAERGRIVIVATHDESLLELGTGNLHIVSGKRQEDEPAPAHDSVPSGV